jgi:signal transduction histidine kinase
VAPKRAREKISIRLQLREYTENLERLVEEKTRGLIQAERLAAVGQNVAGLAHAIKNITSGLKGGIFVLEKGIALDNKTYLSDGWEMIKRNVDKINTLAMDLLSYAKERELNYQLPDPNKVAEEVFHLMELRAQEYGVILKMDLADDLHDIPFDPEALHTCLLNLVSNAIDACADIECSSRSGEVIMRSLKVESWGVEYQVIDNGCGMDKETRDKIFQSFFSTKGTKGTGLGLMISKKTVDGHAGVTEVESEKGRGTKFTIRLPDKSQEILVGIQEPKTVGIEA